VRPPSQPVSTTTPYITTIAQPEMSPQPVVSEKPRDLIRDHVLRHKTRCK
jgi:hypothetical protein